MIVLKGNKQKQWDKTENQLQELEDANFCKLFENVPFNMANIINLKHQRVMDKLAATAWTGPVEKEEAVTLTPAESIMW